MMAAEPTHEVMIVDAAETRRMIIAVGSEEWCWKQVAVWLGSHTLAEGARILVKPLFPSED
jgi:hypothetical protein